jgi:capsid protein
MQQYLIDHFCREVYTEWLISAYLSGELGSIPDFWANKERYMAHEWISPGWQWIDPVKEVNAAVTSLGSGLTTLSQECASKGLDWQELLQQRAREQEYAQTLGLTLNINPQQGGDAIGQESANGAAADADATGAAD